MRPVRKRASQCKCLRYCADLYLQVCVLSSSVVTQAARLPLRRHAFWASTMLIKRLLAHAESTKFTCRVPTSFRKCGAYCKALQRCPRRCLLRRLCDSQPRVSNALAVVWRRCSPTLQSMEKRPSWSNFRCIAWLATATFHLRRPSLSCQRFKPWSCRREQT